MSRTKSQTIFSNYTQLGKFKLRFTHYFINSNLKSFSIYFIKSVDFSIDIYFGQLILIRKMKYFKKLIHLDSVWYYKNCYYVSLLNAIIIYGPDWHLFKRYYTTRFMQICTCWHNAISSHVLSNFRSLFSTHISNSLFYHNFYLASS